MTPTYVKAHDWSLTPLSPAPRSEPRDRAELRTVDDKTKAHLLIFSAQKSSLRVTTPTLCLLGRAGIVGSNPALGLNSSQPPNQNCGDDNNGELLPNDFEQQPNHAEADDKPEQEHRDFGLRLSLRRTFSYGYRFKIGWHDLPPPRMT